MFVFSLIKNNYYVERKAVDSKRGSCYLSHLILTFSLQGPSSGLGSGLFYRLLPCVYQVSLFVSLDLSTTWVAGGDRMTSFACPFCLQHAIGRYSPNRRAGPAVMWAITGYRDTLFCSSCFLFFSPYFVWFLLSFFLVGRTVSAFGSAVGFFPRRSVVHVKGEKFDKVPGVRVVAKETYMWDETTRRTGQV